MVKSSLEDEIIKQARLSDVTDDQLAARVLDAVLTQVSTRWVQENHPLPHYLNKGWRKISSWLAGDSLHTNWKLFIHLRMEASKLLLSVAYSKLMLPMALALLFHSSKDDHRVFYKREVSAVVEDAARRFLAPLSPTVSAQCSLTDLEHGGLLSESEGHMCIDVGVGAPTILEELPVRRDQSSHQQPPASTGMVMADRATALNGAEAAVTMDRLPDSRGQTQRHSLV